MEKELEFLKEELQNYKSENNLLKDTIMNLNFIINTLKESNKALSSELMIIDHEIDNKTKSLSEFLDKHGLSVEDIIEYETEKKMIDDKE